MRRVLAAAVAAPVLLLSACSDDDTAQESATDDTTSSTASEDAAPTTAGDSAEETASAPADDASQTTAPGAGGTEGGRAGQAAADRAKEFLVALVAGDPVVCDYILDFSSEGPMPDSPDYDACQETIPPQAEDQFSAEEQQVFEAISITGADVNKSGDTAVVDADNFSDLFADAFGDQEITLTKIDDRWYVDFNRFGG